MKGIFGRKKAESQENPYARQQQAQEEYDRMTPYQRARADIANSGPRPNIPGGLPSGPGPRRDYGGSPGPSSQSYGGSTYANPPQGYGSDRYGSSSGYGSSRFDSNPTAYSVNQNAPPARVGRYGGLGGRPEDGVNSDELFSGARPTDGPNRYGPQVPQPGEAPNRYAAAGPSRGYEEDNDYDDQDLTPEQQEERQYRRIKNETKKVRREGLDSADRTLAMMNQAEEIGMRTLANLTSQGERLNRVEQNLNMSASHARNAEAKTKELNTLNRSMFAVHVENPLTKKKRLAAQEQAWVEQSRAERGEKEALRGAGYRNQQDMEEFFQDIERRKAAKSKYDMDDSEPEDMSDSEPEEDMNDGNQHGKNPMKMKMHQMAIGAGSLHSIAVKHGEVIRQQNGVIDRIGDKTDGVTDHVVKNSAKLRKF